MAQWRGPAGYNRNVPLANSDSTEDILCWGDDGAVFLEPTLQPVGYIDDFPSKYYDRPNEESIANSTRRYELNPCDQPKTATFPFQDNTEVAQRRVIDIINQCRYLSSKQGMDKEELIRSIKSDEIEGRNYIPTIRTTPLCNFKFINPIGMEFPMHPTWMDSPPEYEKTSYYQIHHSPPPDQKNVSTNDVSPPTETTACVQRPPTRRTTLRTPTPDTDSNSLINYPEGQAPECHFSSDGSDFDVSETSELLSKMELHKGTRESNYDTIDYKVTMGQEGASVSDLSIPPIRKSGTHDFALLIPKTHCNSIQDQIRLTPVASYGGEISQYTSVNSEEEDASSSEDDATEYDEDPRDRFLKNRFEASRKASVASVFGNLDQFDKMLSDSDEKLMNQQAAEKHPSP